jgi:diaminohydroxyphosphoribosylaminopyrimidine deaminase/5-amino-6-(5-phosphoribosylamino)uracil reductase
MEVSSAKAPGSPTAAVVTNETAIDEVFMRRALVLAERARARTGDNPHVGSVIVAAGEVIGEGWTSEPGHHHAEVNAILAAESAGRSVSGATLYATVEPCCFVGRTPACSSLLIAKGFARVVFGVRDPHPRVNGRGAAQLREAGIEVSEAVCEAEVTASLRDWLGGR